MTLVRAVGAGAVAAALWILTAMFATTPIGPRPLGWIEQVIVPGPLTRIGELPLPWPYVAVGGGALMLGALVAGAAMLSRGTARVSIVWLGLAIGSLLVGVVMGVGTIAGEVHRLGVSYPVADVSQALGTQAWGILLGWIPALVAGWARDRAAPRPGLIATAAVAVVATLIAATATGIGGPLRFAALDRGDAPVPQTTPSPTPTVRYSPAPVPGNDYALATTTCPTGALVLVTTGGGAATGHRDFAVEIRNTSSGACTLSGYPAVAFRDARGRAVAATVTPGRSFMDDDPGATELALPPGATAVATVGWDAGSEPNDPTKAHELVVRISAGADEGTIPSDAFDIVGGTAVTVQAWRLGDLSGG